MKKFILILTSIFFQANSMQMDNESQKINQFIENLQIKESDKQSLIEAITIRIDMLSTVLDVNEHSKFKQDKIMQLNHNLEKILSSSSKISSLYYYDICSITKNIANLADQLNAFKQILLKLKSVKTCEEYKKKHDSIDVEEDVNAPANSAAVSNEGPVASLESINWEEAFNRNNSQPRSKE